MRDKIQAITDALETARAAMFSASELSRELYDSLNPAKENWLESFDSHYLNTAHGQALREAFDAILRAQKAHYLKVEVCVGTRVAPDFIADRTDLL